MVERIKAYAHDTRESIVHLINYKDTTFVLFCDEISRGSASKYAPHQQVVFLLSSGGKSVLLAKKKAPSRSGILLSMYVVLKTRHVSPNIHVRRY